MKIAFHQISILDFRRIPALPFLRKFDQDMFVKQRIYIDTSVVGGCFDDEFSDGSLPFFDKAKIGNIVLIVSDLLDAELLRAPDLVKGVLKGIAEKILKELD